MQQIQAKLRRNKPDIVFIDYLQLLQAPADKRGRSRVEEVSAMTRDLKIMAKELNIPVMVAAQLRREAEKGRRPALADLRESGSIEQDADLCMFLHRPDYYRQNDDNYEETHITELLVAKHRHGADGKV